MLRRAVSAGWVVWVWLCGWAQGRDHRHLPRAASLFGAHLYRAGHRATRRSLCACVLIERPPEDLKGLLLPVHKPLCRPPQPLVSRPVHATLTGIRSRGTRLAPRRSRPLLLLGDVAVLHEPRKLLDPRHRAPGAHDGRPHPGRSFRFSSSLGWLRRHASCNSARRRSAASRAFLLALLSRLRSAQRSVTGSPVAGDPPAPARRPRPPAARPALVGLRPKEHPPATASRRFDIFPRKAPKHDGPSARLRTARFRSPKASRWRRLPRFRRLRFHHAAGRRGAVRPGNPLVEALRTGVNLRRPR
jgi:hypothetical protein